LTISKYYTPSGRCIQELDYTNRDLKTGKVPKFSDKIINKFKTQNGRIVYDGGGILPDVKTNSLDKTDLTKELFQSKAIFNFATDYYHNNQKVEKLEDLNITSTIFKDFIQYLEKDTTFVTQQEKLFKEAFNYAQNQNISKELNKIQEELYKQKVDEISKNKEEIEEEIIDEIILKYFYKEGVFIDDLKNDKTIIEAVKLLKNTKEYNRILSSK